MTEGREHRPGSAPAGALGSQQQRLGEKVGHPLVIMQHRQDGLSLPVHLEDQIH